MIKKRAKSTKASAKTTKASVTPRQSDPMTPMDVTTRDIEGRTPLHLAAFYGYSETVHKMLLQQADSNARDQHERTPGHWTAFKGHLEVLKMLVEYGADVNARDNEGRTLLRMAMIGRQRAAEALLLGNGAVL